MENADRIANLPHDLGCVAVSDATLLGDPEGVPTTITVLGGDPLSLLLRFRVDPHGTEMDAIRALLDGAAEEEATVEFDGSFIVFSMYNLGGADNGSIRSVVTHLARTIQATDFAVEPGCQQCGEVESARLLYADERPARLCDECTADAVRRRQELEAELNRPSLAATFGLAGAVTYGAIAWGLFWTVVEFVFRWLRIRVVEINYLTVLIGAATFAAVGYAVGRPIGRTIQRSIALRRVPQLSSALIVPCVGVAGEIVLLTILLLWDAGIFNLAIAANFVWAFVSGYSPFWIICKLALLGFVWFFCTGAAAERRTASPEA